MLVPVVPALASASLCLFVGWAFYPVGPIFDAKEQSIFDSTTITSIPSLNGFLVGSSPPQVALYAGAKVYPASYVPLVAATNISTLILQSPFNIYALKPSHVRDVLSEFPSITCITGHSIGGLWAAEYCADLKLSREWPRKGLSFLYMGVHGPNLQCFKALPFKKVSYR